MNNDFFDMNEIFDWKADKESKPQSDPVQTRSRSVAKIKNIFVSMKKAIFINRMTQSDVYKTLRFKVKYHLFILERKIECTPILRRLYPRRQFYLRLAGMMLVIPCIAVLYMVLFQPKVLAVWFDDSYAFRQKITFTHTVNIESERRITITADTATLITNGRMRSDCADTRFTDVNGKVLRYQLTGTCNNASTTYDVVLPQIYNGDNEAYVYYGNPYARSASENVSSVTSLSPTGLTLATVEKGPSPVLYWKFDEGYGTTANDATIASNSGTLTNSPSWQTGDLCLFEGNCLKFDGINDNVQKLYNSDVELNPGTASMSASLWYKHSSGINNNQYLVSRYSGAGYKIYMKPTGVVCFAIDDDSTWNPDDEACDKRSTADSQWHHLQAVKGEGSTYIRIFVDGQEVGKDESLAATGSLSGTTPTFYVGIDSNGTGSPWSGFIDEVKIYNFAKTSAQIKADFAAKGAKVPVSATLGMTDAANTLSQGLIGYWKLDETAANSCVGGTNDSCDSSGNNGDGAWNGNTTNWPGKFGMGGRFDGAGDFVSVADTATLSATTALSISAWASPSAGITTKALVVKDASYRMVTNGNGNPQCQIHNGSSWQTAASSSAALSLLSWQNVVCTYNGEQVKVYVNGDLKGSANVATSIADSANPLRIGNDAGGTYNDYNGNVDDVRVYNRALSGIETQRLYDFGVSPVSYWSFDEHTGTITHDRSGNGKNLDFPAAAGQAGVTIDNTSSTTYGQVGTVTHSHTTGAGSNQLMLVAVSYNNNEEETVTGVTYNGDAMTLVGDALAHAGATQDDGHVYVYRLLAPDQGTHDVVVTFSTTLAATSQGGSLGVTTFNGVDQVTPLGAWAENQDNLGPAPGPVTVDVSSATDELVYAAMSCELCTSIAVGAGQTPDWGPETYPCSGTSESCYGAGSTEPGATTVTMSWTIVTDSYWAIGGVSIKPASTTASAAPPSWTNGKYGSGLSFNGSSGLTYGDHADHDFSQHDSFTLESWFRHDTQSSGQDIIMGKEESTGADGGWKLLMESDGDITCGVDTDNASFPLDSVTSTAATYDDDVWHHVACVKDTSNALRLYIDGVLIGSDTALSTAGTYANDDAVYIGIDGDASSNGWVGSLDDIRIYRYARTVKQIVSSMNANHPAVGSPVGSALGHWKFDDGFGTTASNSGSVGSGLNGTMLGAIPPTWRQEGKYGKALNFSGSSAYVKIGNASATQVTADLTLSSWIYLSSNSTEQDIIAKRGASGQFGYRLYVNSSGQPVMEVSSNGTATTSVVSPTALTTNRWYHIVGTYAPSSAMKIYVDGQLKNANTSSIPSSIFNSTNDLNIGAENYGTTNRFNGSLDEVKLYNYALNANEVKLDLNQAKGIVLGSLSTDPDGRTASNAASRAYCPPGDNQGNCAGGSLSPAPVGEWKMDENTGMIALDTSGFGNHGVFSSIQNRTREGCVIGTCVKSMVDDILDAVTITNNAALNFTASEDFTWNFWFKATSVEAADTIPFDKGGATAGSVGYNSELNSNGTVQCAFADGVNRDVLTGTRNHLDGNRHFVTCVLDRDGSETGTAGLHLYVDGQYEASDTSLSAGATTASVTDLLLGEDATSREINGSVDQVTVYKYARTPRQISWDLNRGQPTNWWKFDECAGDRLYSSAKTASGSASGAIGTLSGATPGTCNGSSGAWFNGKVGKFNASLDFDGANDVVQINNEPAIDLNEGLATGFAISMWVYAESDGEGDVGQIFNKGANTWCRTDSESGGKVDLQCSLDLATTDATINIGHAFTTNAWHNVVMTWTDDSDDEISIYIDGKLRGTSGDGSGAAAADANNLFIGGNSATNTAAYDGRIDETMVFPYEPTATQVRTLYNQYSAVRFGPNTGSP